MPHGEKNMPTNKWAILGGIALNVDYTRKYGFDATAAAKVTAKLVAVPPPTLFQEAIQADLAGRVRRAIPQPAPVVRPPTRLPSPPPIVPAPVISAPFPSPTTPTVDEDEEFTTLSLIIEEQAGVGYTLDDGVVPPSEGVVAEDGTLVHQVSKASVGCVITFEDDSEPLELNFEDSGDAEDDLTVDETVEEWAELIDVEETSEELGAHDDESGEIIDDEEIEELIDSWVDDDERTVSLVIPEHAGKSYKLDDGITASKGVIDEDGLLLHSVSPEAVGCTIEIEGEPEKIELVFAEEDVLQ
jgi:hypothetical protein